MKLRKRSVRKMNKTEPNRKKAEQDKIIEAEVVKWKKVVKIHNEMNHDQAGRTHANGYNIYKQCNHFIKRGAAVAAKEKALPDFETALLQENQNLKK
ncbi:unnamed protein product [Allacma fusca]|uniref:Uncharacterized protein n=1 Tax=Allacma fusca TaxID=39272 RepID=A0A8J2NU57_9HEXA|nr:unnamed protein product [Allacma fusca]